MWLTEILARNCQQRADRVAVIDGERSLTWAQLDARSRALAGLLHRRGIGHGDLVGVCSRNRLEVLESYFAAAWLGAAFIPLNHALVPAELADIVARLRPGLVLGETELISRTGLTDGELLSFDSVDYQAAIDGPASPLPTTELSLTDPMAILLTSATTGKPKAVVQTHGAMMQMGLGWLAAVRPDDDMVLLNLNPLSHGSIQLTFNYLAAGATVVLLRAFTPQGALREIERSRVTHVWLVPQMLRFILRGQALDHTDLSSLREVMHGAAPMPPAVLTEARRRLPCPLRNVYGMTEVGGPFATVSTAEHRVDDDADWPAGRGIPGLLVNLLTPDGDPVAPGAIGEVCVRGAGRMREYLHDPVATAEAFRGPWLRTGDLGWCDPQGYLHLVDRAKDVVIRAGQNVYPAEIERGLLEHPAVTDASVIRVPDEEWGESPVAYVVRGPEDVTPAQLITYLRGRLASYKIPSAIHLIDEIPRNGAGKALKRVLSERYHEQPAPAATGR